MTTKIDDLTDACSLPSRLALTPGQSHDSFGAVMLLDDRASANVVLGDNNRLISEAARRRRS